MSASATPYHHGDLRSALLTEASAIVREQGVDGLSLRKLAERTGVSRTAPYHHFRDKHALLCALAEQGFHQLQDLMAAHTHREQTLTQRLNDFVHAYLHFALEHPERYELMFGRTIWTSGEPTATLKHTAYQAFRSYLEQVQKLRADGNDRTALRVAQTTWATLHGLCRLMLDGIYVNVGDMEEVAEQTVQSMLSLLQHPA